MFSLPTLSVAGTRSVVSDGSFNINNRSLSLREDETFHPGHAIEDGESIVILSFEK
jgi:hypothetical protein